MRRAVVLVLTLAALAALAGCGVRPSGVVRAGEAPRKYTTEVTALYFQMHGLLARTERIDPKALNVSQKVDLLLAGPNPAERGQGYETALPATSGGGVQVVRVAPHRYELRMNTPVATLSATALDQLVCTVLAGEAAEHAMAVGSVVAVVGTAGRREDRGCPVV
ncbi:hypothetical protein Lfu02_37630 [Longispora fulva]|uniref:GerMN domain-containing protein n=1 Tax=Longispora fulva TaxID=619741 RepID=A0A8J7GQH1_9ACTN|nr:hypothetical protein [Longispora fulva]MBG6141458.1 hypothetical protein [Longispora fulva]GIG59391.1 hypothetical protein Lfu02_37630 [Longispora fulva]